MTFKTFYKDRKTKAGTPDVDIDFFDIASGVLKKGKNKQYSVGTTTNADKADDQAFLAITPAQAESLLYSLEQAARGIGLPVN